MQGIYQKGTMKVTVVDSIFPVAIMTLRDVKVGTVFAGKVAGTTRIMLRTYHCVVDLENPGNTWSENNLSTHVLEYQELDAELIVKFKRN